MVDDHTVEEVKALQDTLKVKLVAKSAVNTRGEIKVHGSLPLELADGA